MEKYKLVWIFYNSSKIIWDNDQSHLTISLRFKSDFNQNP